MRRGAGVHVMTDPLLLMSMSMAFMSMAADKTGSEARFSPTTVVTTIQLALLKLHRTYACGIVNYQRIM